MNMRNVDQVVNSKKFRDELAEKEFEFICEYGDPEKAGAEWDTVFHKAVNQTRKNPSRLEIFFAIYFMLYLINQLIQQMMWFYHNI
jgi:hypothetical protein